MENREITRLKTIKRKYEAEWLKLDNVVAVGIGMTAQGGLGLIVSVSEINDKIKKLIPEEAEGFPVEIKETGRIKAL
ncbi:MAG: hypothetical protein GXO77_00240 [Calditrichaeota bacterium]|nr:hypothetical protein [Calditrichota bacterium]